MFFSFRFFFLRSYVVHISLETHALIYIQWSTVKLLLSFWMDFYKRLPITSLGHTHDEFWRGSDQNETEFDFIKWKEKKEKKNNQKPSYIFIRVVLNSMKIEEVIAR